MDNDNKQYLPYGVEEQLKRIKAKEEEIARLRRQLEYRGEELKKVTIRCYEWEEEAKKVQKETTQKIYLLECSKSNLESTVEMYYKDIEKLVKEKTAKNKEIEYLRKTIEATEQERDRAAKERGSSDTAAGYLRTRIENQSAKIFELRCNLEQADETIEKLRKKHEREILEYQAGRNQAANGWNASQKKIEELQQQIKKLKDENEGLTSSLEISDKAYRSVRDEVDNLRSKLHESQEENKFLAAVLENYKIKLNNLDAQDQHVKIAQLEEALKQEKEYRERLRKDLRATREILEEVDNAIEKTTPEKARAVVDRHNKLALNLSVMGQKYSGAVQKLSANLRPEPSRLEIAAILMVNTASADEALKAADELIMKERWTFQQNKLEWAGVKDYVIEKVELTTNYTNKLEWARVKDYVIENCAQVIAEAYRNGPTKNKSKENE
jgi:chromosome segregation ATPase